MIFYLQFDRLGSVVASSAGPSSYVSLPYGETPSGGSLAGTGFGYAGYRYEAETATYHTRTRTRTRTYDPRLGRFLQTDPIGQADGLNIYRYAANSPTNRTDIAGTAPITAYNGGCGEAGCSTAQITYFRLAPAPAVPQGPIAVLGIIPNTP